MCPRLARVALALATTLVGCSSSSGGSDAPPGVLVCGAGRASVTDRGVVLGDDCGDEVALLPRALLGVAWRGGGADGACSAGAGVVTCPVGEAGKVSASIDASGLVRVKLDAAKDVTVYGLSLDGAAKVAGATSWLSNGFQSWSQSGMLALAPPPDEATLTAALSETADADVVRDGTGNSWTYSFVGGGGPSLFAGARTAATWKPWVQVSRANDGVSLVVRLGSGATGEQVKVAAGASIEGETWQLELGDGLEQMLTRYGKALTTHLSSSHAQAQLGWNSWYQLWDTALDDPAVRDNAALAKTALAAYEKLAPPMRITVDDGWEQAWGDWDPNAKFPSGLDGLAADLSAQGFTMGVWLAPLLVQEHSQVATAHPDWFVGGVSYQHSKNGKMLVLDVTNPDAAAHLTQTIQKIVGWGYTLLKIDFLFAGTIEGTHAQPVTAMQAYGKALDLIRKAAGEGTTLVAVGAPDVATFPYVDGWRVGADIALEPTDITWPNVANEARTVASRWPLCLATLCDADPVMLRKLSHEEVDTGGWVVAASGGALFLSDDLRVLPAERRTWGLDDARATAALGGVPAVPLDPYPADPPATLTNVVLDIVKRQTTHVVPRLWRLPTGVTIAMNVGDDEITVGTTNVPAHAVRPAD